MDLAATMAHGSMPNGNTVATSGYASIWSQDTMRIAISRRGHSRRALALASVKCAYQDPGRSLRQRWLPGSAAPAWQRHAGRRQWHKYRAAVQILICLSFLCLVARADIAHIPQVHDMAGDRIVEGDHWTDISSEIELPALATTSPIPGASAATSVPAAANTPPVEPQTTTSSASPAEFTIVVLPDTQNYSYRYPGIYVSQTQWIVDNQAALNIAFIPHEGDLVATADSKKHWRRASVAMSLLESAITPLHPDGIPYSVLPGNHDQPTDLYNQYFGVSRFQGRDYYGGSYEPDKNDNNYTHFSAEGMDFVVVSLQYEPTRDILAWADSVLQTYSDRRAIVVAHSLIHRTGDFTGYGQLTYEALRDNPNLFLMLAGHRPGEARRMDVHNGNTVHTLLANYQTRENGGNGWLRILTFSPANNQIQVQTYSPYLDQFERDADSEFTLDYAMNADLAISTSASSDPAVAGESLTYTLTISNNGPMDATNVTLTNTLPEDVAFASTTSDQGTCVQAEQTVTCELSNLDAGDATQVTIRGTVDAAQRGVLVNTAAVAGNELDATPANDVSLTVTVVQAEADLAASGHVSSDGGAISWTLTYTLTLTNHDPSDATGVTLTDTLPLGVTFVSATSDQGTCMWAEGTVVCNADAVARDTPFAVAITIRSKVTGMATHTAAGNNYQEERDSGYYENRYLWTRVCGECFICMPGGCRLPGHRRRY